jgi:hypothetical protein
MTLDLDDAAEEAISRNAASMELRESIYLLPAMQAYFQGERLLGFVKLLDDGWKWCPVVGGKQEDANVVYLHPTVLKALKEHLRGNIPT